MDDKYIKKEEQLKNLPEGHPMIPLIQESLKKKRERDEVEKRLKEEKPLS